MVLDITERKRVEGELRRSEARLAAEAAALAKLDDLSSRLWQMSSLQEGLSEMLAAVVGLLGADKANVQLLDAERGVLNIVAQFGFEQPFLDFFREVSLADQSAFGRSLCSGCRIVVEDIETDEAYAPLRAIARASDYRAVTSTPLVRSDGSILGMLSTHFKSPHRPTEESLLRLDLYARQAAGFVQQCKAKRVLSQRYAAIVESSDDAIISKNLDAVIVSWNAGAQRMFGYTEPEAVGQPITILIPPELRDEENKILERLRSGDRIEHYETKRVTKTGKMVDVSLTISPVKNSAGNLVGFSKIAHDITERKRAEELQRETHLALEKQTEELQAREGLLKTFVRNVPAGVAMFDRDMRYLEVSDRWCVDYGVDGSRIIGRSHYEVFPDLPHHWKEMHRRGLEGETLRAALDCWERQGRTTWVRWEIRPWRTSSGAVGGILIFAEEITHLKQMEASLSGMTQKLIESQEKERARIARELHDDVAQRIALLCIGLDQLQHAHMDSEVSTRIGVLRRQTDEILADVQSLSHELHSSKLEHLGIVAAMRNLCKEFGGQQKMEVVFQSGDLPSPLPPEVSISLFRVLQEALRNAAKHSGVKNVEVRILETTDEIHLTIGDSGRGFDVATAMQGRGLGLTSMQERIRLVNGTISIESKPMGGTTIHVRVPLGSEHGSQRAAG